VARAAKIATGDRVRVRSGGRELTATAIVGEDVAAGTVALRFGGGRRSDVAAAASQGGRRRSDVVAAASPAFQSGRRRSGVGASGNVMELLSPVLDPLSGELAYVQARASIARLGPGSLASVSGGSRSEERLLCLDVSLRDARAGRWPVLTREGDLSAEERQRRARRAHGEHEGPRGSREAGEHGLPMPHDEPEGARPADNLHELQRFPEHRWGMVVDLDRCTGCGACVVACYAENNIPVVGRDQVLKGRELSWIRIEKHVFSRGAGGRQVRFLPVMCQHCAQAPCETVCPVFAAYHTPDGLNAQIYNRCIGTRYCANNCPYKVRRFNYFDWPREQPATQQLNPDVTVRSRGVMEKCTFCIQRIREVTNRAKADGRPIRDGEIQPACVQTCPTGALSFGDFKQPSWTMSRRARHPRAYRLLDYMVNTRPSVVYLRKVVSDDRT
jgi:molybdopterin-containing oxidoreductase family iron-sulfur binding subunit